MPSTKDGKNGQTAGRNVAVPARHVVTDHQGQDATDPGQVVPDRPAGATQARLADAATAATVPAKGEALDVVHSLNAESSLPLLCPNSM